MAPISGACLNPALGFGINLCHAIKTGEGWGNMFAYTIIGLVASLAASIIFSLGRAAEFDGYEEQGNGDEEEFQ